MNGLTAQMDPQWKAEWLAALRSGEYQQGSGRLRLARSDAPRHCCLGVLCDLAVKKGEGRWTDDSEFYDGVDLVITGSYPSERMLQLLGLPYQAAAELAAQNDLGADFNEIADLIEKYL